MDDQRFYWRKASVWADTGNTDGCQCREAKTGGTNMSLLRVLCQFQSSGFNISELSLEGSVLVQLSWHSALYFLYYLANKHHPSHSSASASAPVEEQTSTDSNRARYLSVTPCCFCILNRWRSGFRTAGWSGGTPKKGSCCQRAAVASRPFPPKPTPTPTSPTWAAPSASSWGLQPTARSPTSTTTTTTTTTTSPLRQSPANSQSSQSLTVKKSQFHKRSTWKDSSRRADGSRSKVPESALYIDVFTPRVSVQCCLYGAPYVLTEPI